MSEPGSEAPASRRFDTAAKLIDHLGIPPERIRVIPEPGSATLADVLNHNRESGKLCELIDGILVEKALGYYESRLAVVLPFFLEEFLATNDLGIVIGESGMVWVEPGQMRMADVAFISWDHFPNRILPAGAVLDLTPDWAIEILSPSNTVAEMTRKRREYFDGGAKLVWQADPGTRSVAVYTAVDDVTTHGEDATVTGAPVLPGFSLSIRRWFERAGQRA
jgi:Uma2 family endonuclease